MAERDLLVRILGDDRDLRRALANTEQSVQRLDTRTAAFGKNIKTAFAAAGITVGLSTLTTSMGRIIQSSIDFEEAFAGVRKTVDASEAEFDELAAGIRQLAKEIPITVTELAAIAEAAGQLGIAKANILDFTRTVADLAATTDLTSDTAADAFARLTNITGLPQDQVSNLGSAVVDLGNKLAATESEIVDFATRIAGAGRQAGLTDAQIVAIAGAFRSVGVESEAGGTAVQKVLLQMTSAALSGGKKLAQFAQVAGQSAEEFRKSFSEDAGAAFTDFVQGLEAVRERGGNAFEVLERLGLVDQRLVRAFLSMSSNSDLLARSLQIGTQAFEENTALTEEAGKRYETTASQIQIFKNNVNDLAITLGDDLLRNLSLTIDAVIDLHDALSDLKALAPVEIPIDVPVSILFDARTPGGAQDLLGRIGDEIKSGLESLTSAGLTPFENLESLLRGEGGGGLRLFPSPSTDAANEATKEFLEKVEKDAEDTKDQARDVSLTLKEQRQAFDEFVKGMGLKLETAQLTASVDDDIAALRELESAIQRRINIEGRTFKLASLLASTRLQIQRLVEQRAEDARQAGEDAFNATVDALSLELEMARATKSLADDQTALRALEQAILRRIETEGRTTDLMRQLFNVRQDQKDVAQRLADQKREQRQGKQFEALGLTAEGQERVPSIGALRRRGRGLIDELKASGLDEDQVSKFVKRISVIFTDQFDTAGREIRQAILDLFAMINDTLDEGSKKGPLTKTTGLNTKKIVEGLGLSEEEIRALRGRLSGFNSAGLALAGGGGARTSTTGGFGGIQGAVLVENHVTVEIDGQKITSTVTKQQQRAKRRNPRQKRGPNRNI